MPSQLPSTLVHYPKILLVEPSFEIRTRLVKAFQQQKVYVMTASDGAEAKELIRAHGAPALAIVSLHLPNEKGDELARKLVKRHSIAIIMTAQHADSPTIVRLLDSLAQDVIRLPVDEREVVARAFRLLARITSIVQPNGPSPGEQLCLEYWQHLQRQRDLRFRF